MTLSDQTPCKEKSTICTITFRVTAYSFMNKEQCAVFGLCNSALKITLQKYNALNLSETLHNAIQWILQQTGSLPATEACPTPSLLGCCFFGFNGAVTVSLLSSAATHPSVLLSLVARSHSRCWSFVLRVCRRICLDAQFLSA